MSVPDLRIHGSRGRLSLVALIASVVASFSAPASSQVYVNGQAEGITIKARPVQRTYAQVYSTESRARLITKQSVMDNGGTIPPAQSAVYVQEYYGQPVVTSFQASPASGEFRLDPYASKRYLNKHYYDGYRSSNRYYSPWYGSYAYQYAPGFYYYWRPSFSRYGYHYRPHSSYCGPRSHRGGSYLRFSSSSGFNFRLRF